MSLTIEEIVACVHDTSNENDEMADETELELPPVLNHESIQAMNIVVSIHRKKCGWLYSPQDVWQTWWCHCLKKMKQSSLFYYQIRS